MKTKQNPLFKCCNLQMATTIKIKYGKFAKNYIFLLKFFIFRAPDLKL